MALRTDLMIANFDLNENITLARLKPVRLENGSLVERCMEGTRQDIFARIEDWAADIGAPNILWIKGHPGVGKSAVASSLVAQLRSSNRLGSSFFSRRDGSSMTTNALWRSVAYDLAQQYSAVRRCLLATLKADDFIITTADTSRLFYQIIQAPLMASEEWPVDRLPVIVVDALDESGGLEGRHSKDRSSLMRTLKSWSRLPGRFKLIVTSREEKDIHQLFATTSHRDIYMSAGQAVNAQSQEDIELLLTRRLRPVAAQYPATLPPDWPGPDIIKELGDKAGGLFKWADIAVKIIARGEPQDQLRQILAGNGIGDMCALYASILNTSFPSPSEKVIHCFHSVMGAIILAQKPLSIASLIRLLSMKSSMVNSICKGLQPVVDSRDVLRINHQSFVDFLIDPQQCPRVFVIDLERENRRLTVACLQVMKNQLRFNICDLRSPYLRNIDIPDLDSRIEKRIPPYISYSCCFWAIHLEQTTFDIEIFKSLQYFMRNQFLFWLEVLSLTRRVNLASGMLLLLIDWIQAGHKDYEMATDMWHFVAVFATSIFQSAPHIYLSALPFSPQNSAVWKQYSQQFMRKLAIHTGGLGSWPATGNIMSGHTRAVASVAFSPDGRRIVSGSGDRTIRVWDAETGEVVVGPLEGHTGPVSSVAFSPDGKRITSGSHDMTIRIWDAETGEVVLALLERQTGPVSSVAFSPDGRRLVSSSSHNKTIRVWDSETGEVVVSRLEGHTGPVSSVAFSPDGKRIVSGSHDMTIRVWDAETGEVVVGPLKGHADWINPVAFLPDGGSIVSGSDDETIRVWDAETGEVVVGPLKGHIGPVSSVAFSPDGNYIASGSHDKTIRVWDAETGEVVVGPLQGHADWINSVAFSPDGRRIVSGSHDETIRVWHVEGGDVVADPPQGHVDWINSVAFSPDGRRIVSSSHDMTIRVWDAETGEMALGLLQGHTDWISSATFSPDGRRIVSGSHDMTIQVWDAETGKVVVGPLKGHTGPVNSVAFSPDGKRIASGSDDEIIRVWDAETGELVLGPLQGHTDWIKSVVFSPDGRHIVSGSHDKTIRVWDAETGDVVISPLQGHTGWVKSVAFSPDGRCIVSGSYDKTIRVWDAETGEVVVGPLEGHTGPVSSVAFSPEGRLVVSGSHDMTIQVCDVKTGKVVLGPLKGHTGPVSSVAFSPDGKRIVSGSDDEIIRVWDAQADPTTLTKSASFTDGSTLNDGWILGSNSELLFWIPPGIRAGLWRPGNTFVISKPLATKLDLKRFVHGGSWPLCYSRDNGTMQLDSTATEERQRIIEQISLWYHQTGPAAHLKDEDVIGNYYSIRLIGLNLEGADTSIMVDQNSTFSQIGLQLYYANPATLPVALEQISGPYPRWRVPKNNTKIPRGLQKFYVADLRKPFNLALIRKVNEDIPLLIGGLISVMIDPDGSLCPEWSLLRSAGTTTVGTLIGTRFDIRASYIKLFSRPDDIQSSPCDLIEKEIGGPYSTVFMVVMNDDPICYAPTTITMPGQFRTDQGYPVPLLLRAAYLQSQRLVEDADAYLRGNRPHLKVFALPAIHLSRALRHLIVSLSGAHPHSKAENMVEVYHISRLISLLSKLKNNFIAIDNLTPPAECASQLVQFFYELCEEQPGVVSVRQSFESFKGFILESQKDMLESEHFPEPQTYEREAPGGDVTTLAKGDSPSTSDSSDYYSESSESSHEQPWIPSNPETLTDREFYAQSRPNQPQSTYQPSVGATSLVESLTMASTASTHSLTTVTSRVEPPSIGSPVKHNSKEQTASSSGAVGEAPRKATMLRPTDTAVTRLEPLRQLPQEEQTYQRIFSSRD